MTSDSYVCQAINGANCI